MLWLNNRSRSDRKNVRTLRDGLRGDDEGTYIQLLDDGHLAQMEMTIDVLSALLQMPRKEWLHRRSCWIKVGFETTLQVPDLSGKGGRD